MPPYTDEQRKVFKYHNGESEVYGDPLAIDLALRSATSGRLDEILKRYNESRDTEGGWVEPLQQLIAAARQAFGIVWDASKGTGTGKECVDALWAFLEWSEKNAEKAANSPTGSRPSPSTPSAGPSPSSNTGR